jgi:hypothetical protein
VIQGFPANKIEVNAASSPKGMPNWFAPLSIFAAGCVINWYNAAPSATFHDSGEFALAAASAGIPHAPGSPLMRSLSAHFFVSVSLPNLPARATYSRAYGAATLALVFQITRQWIAACFPGLRRGLGNLAALSAPLVLLASRAFLEQSFVTEQYTLLTALFAWLLLQGTVLFQRTQNCGDETTCLPLQSWPIRGRAFLLGGIAGLAIGNHPSQLCLVFPIAGILYSCARPGRRLADIRTLMPLVCLGTLGALLVFIWIPIRSAANPIMDSGNGKTLHSLVRMISPGAIFRDDR